ncbi:putative O-glycosylation ligase, exosortase A system-associated [Ectothiorhodospira lacustris]|uniref:putative O-glycosylation ligase, exosortase A system-associated n=1 Tax=Ectothiorhodospira lacustris TaxID=2899127 RepID=UPI001EE926A5|nr:putative O-glycosylation ligase, exosortase A system-associated [Ectothiorhodospira lacustris]MCG5502058.1 putative O-glycosylation ligase, exosortase A system-associated [Ectothiorhodospira lacustris]
MRDILLIIIIGGSLPFILFMPWIGVLMWYWIGLMNPHRLGWTFITDMSVAMMVGVVTLAALVLTRDRKPLPFTREIVVLVIFTGYITMTTYFAWSHMAWVQWDTVMKILLMTFVTPMLIYGQTRTLLLILVVAGSIAFYGFKGGLFSVLTGGSHMVLGPRDSFIAGNTDLGLAMIMILPMLLIIARMFRENWVDLGILSRSPKIAGYAAYSVFWLTAAAIIFTYSRGALLGLLAIAPFMFLKMRRKGSLILAAVLAVTVIGVTLPERLVSRWQTIQTYEEDHSAMQRVQAWGVNWNMAMERPLLGAGFNNVYIPDEVWVGYANFIGPWHPNTARVAHSLYFQVIGHHGFGGFAVFMTMILFTLLTLNRIRRQSRHIPGKEWMGQFAWAMQVGFVGYLVAGAFLDRAYFDLMFAMVAITIILRRELDTVEAPAPQRVGTENPGHESSSPAPRDFVRTPENVQASHAATTDRPMSRQAP